MKKEERRTRIMEMLEHSGRLAVREIMDVLSVSDMTVRRDLNELSRQGVLIRTHGGAQRISFRDTGAERSHLEKKLLRETEKNSIAKAAADLVENGETIYLGPGTTIEALASYLKNRPLRIVTNSLPVFEVLRCSMNTDLILTGGEYRAVTGGLVGPAAVRSLEGMRFSKAFVGADGAAGGAVFTYSEAEGQIQSLALESAAEKYLAVDSTKFGRYDFCEFCRLDDFDHIITDQGIPDELLEELQGCSDIIVVGE